MSVRRKLLVHQCSAHGIHAFKCKRHLRCPQNLGDIIMPKCNINIEALGDQLECLDEKAPPMLESLQARIEVGPSHLKHPPCITSYGTFKSKRNKTLYLPYCKRVGNGKLFRKKSTKDTFLATEPIIYCSANSTICTHQELNHNTSRFTMVLCLV